MRILDTSIAVKWFFTDEPYFVALAKRFKWVWLTTDGKALMKLPRSLALPLSKFSPSR